MSKKVSGGGRTVGGSDEALSDERTMRERMAAAAEARMKALQNPSS